jgi:hypothetical protein
LSPATKFRSPLQVNEYGADWVKECLICHQEIKCPNVGPAGLKLHIDSGPCKKATKKLCGIYNNLASASSTAFENFFIKNPMLQSSTYVPTGPSPILSYPSKANVLIEDAPSRARLYNQAKQSLQQSWQPMKGCSEAHAAVICTMDIAANLPNYISQATDMDVLSKFGVLGPEFALMNCKPGSKCNGLEDGLSEIFGYGNSPNEVSRHICRGKKGVEGLCKILQFFIAEHGLMAAMLHGRLNTLQDAMMQLWGTVVIYQVKNETNTPNQRITKNQVEEGGTSITSGSQENPIDIEDKCAPILAPRVNSSISLPTQQQKPRDPWCISIRMKLPDGMDAYVSYPFALHHRTRNYEWDLHIVQHELFVQSWSCTHVGQTKDSKDNGTPTTLPCASCEKLSFNSNLMGICHQLMASIHENSPNVYHPISGLWNKLALNHNHINHLHLLQFNAQKQLASCMRTMGSYNHFVMAVASGSVEGMSALIWVALMNGTAIGGILQKINDAVHGLYKPKGYTATEKMQAIFFYHLGGACITEIAYWSAGFPSPSTTL